MSGKCLIAFQSLSKRRFNWQSLKSMGTQLKMLQSGQQNMGAAHFVCTETFVRPRLTWRLQVTQPLGALSSCAPGSWHVRNLASCLFLLSESKCQGSSYQQNKCWSSYWVKTHISLQFQVFKLVPNINDEAYLLWWLTTVMSLKIAPFMPSLLTSYKPLITYNSVYFCSWLKASVQAASAERLLVCGWFRQKQ